MREYKDIIVHTADIHWCDEYRHLIINPMEELIQYIKENSPRYVVIAGDYFEKRINNDDKLFIETISYLLKMKKYCKNLIVIKGTQSHDNFTLSILKEFEKILDGLYYFENLTIKEIDGEKWILIPEEYPENPMEYYKHIYEEKDVKYITGHGELDGALLHSGIDNRKLKGWKFNVNLLETTGCKWNMWGHIHKPQSLSKKTFYSGTLSRNKFGEEEDKGFRVYTCNGEDTEFIVTKTSKKFITVQNKEVKKILEDKNELEKIKDKNIYLRFEGEKDDELFLKLNKILDKEITFKNSIKKISEEENKINDKILFKNISSKEVLDQYLEVLEDELKNKKLTKKEREILEDNSFKEKIKEILAKPS